MTTSRWSFPMAALSSRHSDGFPSAPMCAPILTGLQDSASNSIVSGLCSTSTSPISRLRAKARSPRNSGVPVFGKNRFLGVVLVRLNTHEILKIVSDHTGLGATGETLLNRRIDERAVIMVPLRRGPDAPFTRSVALGSLFGIPEQRSVQGALGEGVSVDYQNRPVLAVWRYVPQVGAGLVVKIDAAEAYAPIRYLTLLAIILAGTTVALVVVAARSLARSIAGPVVTLTDATSRIAEGDLSRRVEVTATNEIGQLARSFNRMTEQLANSIDELTRTTAAKERIESELRVAHDIQMGILPKIFPPFPHRPEFDLHAMLEPAKAVGGDFYDFLLFDDEELYFIIGDVSGKGVPASLFMAVTLTLFRSSVGRGISPGALLTKLNRDLCVDNASSLFVTFSVRAWKSGPARWCSPTRATIPRIM